MDNNLIFFIIKNMIFKDKYYCRFISKVYINICIMWCECDILVYLKLVINVE